MSTPVADNIKNSFLDPKLWIIVIIQLVSIVYFAGVTRGQIDALKDGQAQTREEVKELRQQFQTWILTKYAVTKESP